MFFDLFILFVTCAVHLLYIHEHVFTVDWILFSEYNNERYFRLKPFVNLTNKHPACQFPVKQILTSGRKAVVWEVEITTLYVCFIFSKYGILIILDSRIWIIHKHNISYKLFDVLLDIYTKFIYKLSYSLNK